MRSNPFKRLTVVLMALVFCLVGGLSLAAEKQWFVVKDKAGKCSVRSSTKGKTAATIEGPFATKEEAAKAKATACPKKESVKQWVVVKDKTGKCSVRSTKEGKTAATVQGPFATKEEAVKAKATACPKPEKPKKEGGKPLDK